MKQHMVSENGEPAVVIAMKLLAKHCLTLLTALKQNTYLFLSAEGTPRGRTPCAPCHLPKPTPIVPPLSPWQPLKQAITVLTRQQADTLGWDLILSYDHVRKTYDVAVCLQREGGS